MLHLSAEPSFDLSSTLFNSCLICNSCFTASCELSAWGSHSGGRTGIVRIPSESTMWRTRSRNMTVRKRVSVDPWISIASLTLLRYIWVQTWCWLALALTPAVLNLPRLRGVHHQRLLEGFGSFTCPRVYRYIKDRCYWDKDGRSRWLLGVPYMCGRIFLREGEIQSEMGFK